ncbi:MAG TPA: imidazolonepropionase [Polyangia bacterium]|nr:imidazolonepropionase [Polyangia bacterium]
MQDVDLVVHGSSQLLAIEPLPEASSEQAAGAGEADAAALGVVPGGALAISGGRIVDAGAGDRILDTYRGQRVIDAAGRVVMPGLVDPHTHAVFAGSRHLEFGLRMRGAAYLEILAAGGGIHSTVEATRSATRDRLVVEALPRLARALAFGVTTMEIKSGYGLDVDTEIRMLEAVAELDRRQPMRLVPTYLGAHVVPREFEGRRGDYLHLMIHRVLPEIVRRGLAQACDVYVDEGAYTIDEARALLEAAAGLGLATKIHAGQFTDQGGPELIAGLGGLSADHLEVISDAGVAALAASGTVANLLPGAAMCLRDRFPDGRRLADAGVTVAVATDDNPGSSRTENLPLMAQLAATRMGLSSAEAIRGVTVNAARALGLEGEAGSLLPGRSADILILAVPDFRAFLYHFGVNHTATVIAGGEVVFEEPCQP